MESLFPDLQPTEEPCSGLWAAKHHARSTDPETSKDAAEAAEGLSARHMKVILGALRRNPGGLTSQEIEEALSGTETPLGYYQIARRIIDLRVRGEIEDSGLRRPTKSNRQATVWRCRW